MSSPERLRLFVVDEHKLVRQGLSGLLGECPDFAVVGEAANCIDAIDRVRTSRPDILLTDLHLGDSDKLPAIAQLKHEFPQLKMLMLTASADNPEIVYIAIKAGALGLIAKSSGVEEVIRGIKLIAQGKVVFSSLSITGLVDFIVHTPNPMEPKPEALDQLSARESEVLELIAQGCSNREIAESLCLSESTVRSHVHHILVKLQMSNRVQAAAFALSKIHVARKGPERMAADMAPPPDVPVRESKTDSSDANAASPSSG